MSYIQELQEINTEIAKWVNRWNTYKDTLSKNVIARLTARRRQVVDKLLKY